MTQSTREPPLGELSGVLIAIVSSCLGGTATVVTHYLVGNADPITLAILRWGIGFLVLLPVASLLRARWPQRGDLLAVAALGLCLFGLFFVLYNIAVLRSAIRLRRAPASRFRPCRYKPWSLAPYSVSSR
jgi:drug/metabolite transporter (DMT)-like permease